MPREPSHSESEALAKSEGLLRFAAENVKDLPQTVVSTICAALDAKEDHAWDHSIATDFWRAFNSLCTLIQPATIDTLSTNLREIPPPKWRFWVRTPRHLSLSRRSAARYLTLLMSLLFFSVILGFLISTAATLSSEMQKLIDDCNQVTDKMASEIDLLEPAVSTRAFSKVQAKHQKAIALLQSELLQMDHLMHQILQRDDQVTRLMLFGFARERYQHGDPNAAVDIANLREAIRSYHVYREYMAEDLLRVKVRMGVISSSILPIILGIMGACAFVVRLISEQIKNTTFSQTSPIRHLVRVALGGLAGVVIGFGGVVSASSLSSSALAFIAGYAVEPVFATFDSIAEKFRR